MCFFWLSLGYFKYKLNLIIFFLIGIMLTFKAKKKKKNPLKSGSTSVTHGPDLTRPAKYAGRIRVDTIFVPRSKNLLPHTHIFLSDTGRKMGSGQILSGSL